MLVDDQDHDSRITPPRSWSQLPWSSPNESCMTRVPIPPIAFGADDDGGEDVAETADHGVADRR